MKNLYSLVSAIPSVQWASLSTSRQRWPRITSDTLWKITLWRIHCFSKERRKPLAKARSRRRIHVLYAINQWAWCSNPEVKRMKAHSSKLMRPVSLSSNTRMNFQMGKKSTHGATRSSLMKTRHSSLRLGSPLRTISWSIACADRFRTLPWCNATNARYGITSRVLITFQLSVKQGKKIRARIKMIGHARSVSNGLATSTKY
jgi:hypothetical protein